MQHNLIKIKKWYPAYVDSCISIKRHPLPSSVVRVPQEFKNFEDIWISRFQRIVNMGDRKDERTIV